MKKINEIIFFTYGDSAKISTWSNVPFLFAENLIKKGIKVERIDLLQTPCRKILTKVGAAIRSLLNIVYPNNQYSYYRSDLFVYLTNRLVKKSVKRYTTADLCIFTTFDFYNKFSQIPSLCFCDWTYEILIENRLGRKPYFFEKLFVLYENAVIEHAEYVISLFPVCAKLIKENIPSANVHYLKSNVVNSTYVGQHDVEAFIKKKNSHKHILFIGGKHYFSGATLLIEAIKHLHEKYHDIRLDIVGMSKNQFDNLPDFIHCHGYLNKDVKNERDLYYNLLIEASLISNPTMEWAGYSSTVEAMYFATPVVVSPYKDFVDEFGEEIRFGAYNKDFNSDSLAETIEAVIMSEKYQTICMCAYESVKGYTWDKYVDKILKIVSNE